MNAEVDAGVSYEKGHGDAQPACTAAKEPYHDGEGTPGGSMTRRHGRESMPVTRNQAHVRQSHRRTGALPELLQRSGNPISRHQGCQHRHHDERRTPAAAFLHDDGCQDEEQRVEGLVPAQPGHEGIPTGTGKVTID